MGRRVGQMGLGGEKGTTRPQRRSGDALEGENGRCCWHSVVFFSLIHLWLGKSSPLTFHDIHPDNMSQMCLYGGRSNNTRSPATRGASCDSYSMGMCSPPWSSDGGHGDSPSCSPLYSPVSGQSAPHGSHAHGIGNTNRPITWLFPMAVAIPLTSHPAALFYPRITCGCQDP